MYFLGKRFSPSGCCCSNSAPYSWLPVFQECLHLIRRVCVEEATGTELTNKLTEHLKEILADNKVRATVLALSQTSKRWSRLGLLVWTHSSCPWSRFCVLRRWIIWCRDVRAPLLKAFLSLYVFSVVVLVQKGNWLQQEKCVFEC